MITPLRKALYGAFHELACEGCGNSSIGREDECRVCHGGHRNVETIALLRQLVEQAEARGETALCKALEGGQDL